MASCRTHPSFFTTTPLIGQEVTLHFADTSQLSRTMAELTHDVPGETAHTYIQRMNHYRKYHYEQKGDTIYFHGIPEPTIVPFGFGGGAVSKKHGESIQARPLIQGGVQYYSHEHLRRYSLHLRGFCMKRILLELRQILSLKSHLHMSLESGSFFSPFEEWDATYYSRSALRFVRYHTPWFGLGGGIQHGYYRYENHTPPDTVRFHEAHLLLLYRLSLGHGRHTMHVDGELADNTLTAPQIHDFTAENTQWKNHITAIYHLSPPSMMLSGRIVSDITLRGSRTPYEYLYLGSEESLRGYAQGALGQNVGAENRLFGSGEFTFPLIPVQTISVGALEKRFSRVLPLSVSLDGALFMDAGRLWNTNGTTVEWGIGAGGGLRIRNHTVNVTGHIDVAAPVSYTASTQMSGPVLHIYVGTLF
ncbi:BamA/TamA family outer membrane protein [Chitinivibrio alkaliphilus]|nr:BamA/TamA family outer membrane protein [Chitinivibrio alkaliphilus]